MTPLNTKNKIKSIYSTHRSLHDLALASALTCFLHSSLARSPQAHGLLCCGYRTLCRCVPRVPPFFSFAVSSSTMTLPSICKDHRYPHFIYVSGQKSPNTFPVCYLNSSHITLFLCTTSLFFKALLPEDNITAFSFYGLSSLLEHKLQVVDPLFSHCFIRWQTSSWGT